MKVMLVPSSVTAPQGLQYATSFLINDTVALDAGSIGFYGTPRDQRRIKHVVLSHSHIDHIASLPLFVENAYEAKPDCVTIHGNDAVLECLRKDIFNNRVWPDFLALSKPQTPFLKLQEIRAGVPLEVAGLRILPVSVHHVVPTLGFIVEDGASAVVFPMDTGPTDAIWALANHTPNVKAVFLEVAFPNAMAQLATISMHHTPATFAREVQKLHLRVPFIAVHIKAAFHDQVVSELEALGLPNLEIRQPGKVYQF